MTRTQRQLLALAIVPLILFCAAVPLWAQSRQPAEGPGGARAVMAVQVKAAAPLAPSAVPPHPLLGDLRIRRRAGPLHRP